ncbi:MAG: hypothetical protein ACREGR_03540 [Minisyncoccia bacterium]
MTTKGHERQTHLVTKDLCLYGTQKTPKRWKPCCESFEYRVKSCVYDIRYEWFGRGKWGIVLSEIVGGGYIHIKYCPHCGKKL